MKIIVIFIIVFSSLAIGYQIYRYNDIKKDASVFDEHWQKFLKADVLNDIEGIKFYGDKLIWNRHIETEHLHRMNRVVTSRLEKHQELKKLSNAIFNKNRHLERPLPVSGNNGGRRKFDN
ncbi:hypothetical protein [Psychroserpens algicola]|uniref:hypothetical protein n=1 Tax=Psychroserpens algicola TaxID=1719034 RepID=UPI0019543638|nr:hypothetical protein [Psychroserpens algicola]